MSILPGKIKKRPAAGAARHAAGLDPCQGGTLYERYPQGCLTMGNIQRRSNGQYQARYRDSQGKEHSKCFARKLDARRWLESAGSPLGTPRRPRYPEVESWSPDAPEAFRRRLPVLPPPARPTSVYRFFDEGGTLLYVGISVTGYRRWHGHRLDKEWWPRVCYANIEHFADTPSALAAEEKAIKAEHPVFNVQHRMDADQSRTPEGAR